MTQMKVKCSICNKEETIPNDTLYTVSEMVKKYNMGSSGFTHLFDVMFGQCLDDSTHNFDFTEDFKNEILAIVNKEKNIIIESENAKKESDLIIKEIATLKEKLKETETKYEINRDRIVSLRNEHNELSSEIQKLTYIDKVDMWY